MNIKIFSRVLRKGLLDGILVQSGEFGDLLIDDLCKSEIPLVIAGRPFDSKDVSYIDINNVKAAHEAVTHLINQGHQRIGTIAGAPDNTVSIDRLNGYKKALEDAGIPVDESLIVKGDYSEVCGYQSMQKLLPANPDAVFAASDAMAIGAIRAVQDVGLHVPDDIAFVGFDDLPLATMPNIQLTTVRQPVFEFGYTAIEMLIELIEKGSTDPKQLILETELIIRDSCGSSK